MQFRSFAASILVIAAVAAASACAAGQVATPAPPPLSVSDSAIDINTADERTLESLPGIGPATARKIVSHREKHGPFRRAEHLLLVDGISEKKYRAIRGLVVAR